MHFIGRSDSGLIRVLHIVHVLSRGGGLSNFIMNYYRNIDRSKIQFDFIYFKECENDFKEEIESLGGRYFKMPEPSFSPVFFKARDVFFADYGADYSAVHCHVLYAAAFFGRRAKKEGIKRVIIHSHSANLGKGFLRKIRNRAIIALGKHNANCFAACSKSAAEFMFGKRAVQNGKVTVLNNAIDCEKYIFNADTRSAVRKELGIGENTLAVGHAGGFVPLKNHSFLIDVFSELHRQNPDSVLLLMGGEGTAQASVKGDIVKKVSALGLAGSVKFLGVRSDLDRIFAGLDCFVLPSLFEGLGIALVEAQAAGLMCVASTGVPQITNCTGRVEFVPLGCGAEAWSNKILKFGTEYDRYVTPQLLADFDVSCQVKVLENLYGDFDD